MKTPQISLASCYQAYQECRRYKRRKSGVLAYEARLLDELLAMRDALNARRWLPSRSYCFVVTRPKAREIHAALFNLKNAVESQKPMQATNAPSKFKKLLITNKVTAHFFNSLCTSVSYMSFLRSTAFSRFKDRVVHHWLVPRLEVLFEPVFIHDSYSNRQGKGTHKAVDRLQSFMRKVSGRATLVAPKQAPCTSFKTNPKTSNKPNGYYLQLDIKNFFNRINRKILFQLLKKRMNKSVRQRKITQEEADMYLYLCYQLLRKHPASHTRYLGGKNRDKVPAYKRLSNAPEACGLPIGNLTSQFFANVYLNELDQHVKHTLKCKHTVRYVDDFVLLHEDKQQLLQWRSEIEYFLHETLKLELKKREPVKPISQGVDFLGFITRPHYRLVRRRVVQHLRLQLRQFERKWLRQVPGEVTETADFRMINASIQKSDSNSLLHLNVNYKKVAISLKRDNLVPTVSVGTQSTTLQRCVRNAGARERVDSLLHLNVNYKKVMELQSILASYLGHFKHANSERLLQKIGQEYSWLSLLFKRPVGSYRLIPVWNPQSVSSFSHQCSLFKRHYFKGKAEGVLFIQTGWKLLILGSQSGAAIEIARPRRIGNNEDTKRPLPEKGREYYPLQERDNLFHYLRSLKIPYVYIAEQGYLRGGLKRRVLKEYFGGAYV